MIWLAINAIAFTMNVNRMSLLPRASNAIRMIFKPTTQFWSCKLMEFLFVNNVVVCDKCFFLFGLISPFRIQKNSYMKSNFTCISCFIYLQHEKKIAFASISLKFTCCVLRCFESIHLPCQKHRCSCQNINSNKC